MVENAIIDSEDYQKKTQLWKSLPKKMQYQTFKRVLDYLEASGKIIYDEGEIIYVYPHSDKLKELIRTSIELK